MAELSRAYRYQEISAIPDVYRPTADGLIGVLRDFQILSRLDVESGFPVGLDLGRNRPMRSEQFWGYAGGQDGEGRWVAGWWLRLRDGNQKWVPHIELRLPIAGGSGGAGETLYVNTDLSLPGISAGSPVISQMEIGWEWENGQKDAVGFRWWQNGRCYRFLARQCFPPDYDGVAGWKEVAVSRETVGRQGQLLTGTGLDLRICTVFEPAAAWNTLAALARKGLYQHGSLVSLVNDVLLGGKRAYPL